MYRHYGNSLLNATYRQFQVLHNLHAGRWNRYMYTEPRDTFTPWGSRAYVAPSTYAFYTSRVIDRMIIMLSAVFLYFKIYIQCTTFNNFINIQQYTCKIEKFDNHQNPRKISPLSTRVWQAVCSFNQINWVLLINWVSFSNKPGLLGNKPGLL
jgi:hypothetical protein